MRRVLSVALAALMALQALPAAPVGAAADVDSKEDLVAVVPAANGKVTYMIGRSRGDGTFVWSKTSLVRVARPSSIGVGDVDGDGSDDIVAVVPDGALWKYVVYVNNGGGSFVATTSSLVGMPKPYAIAVGRINSDDFADIVAAEKGSDGRATYMYGFGRGDSTFGWSPTGISGRAVPFGIRMASSTGDVIIAEKQPDGQAAFVIAWGATAIKTTNLVNMTPPIGFDGFIGWWSNRDDIGAMEPASRSRSRLMVGRLKAVGSYEWGFTNLSSKPRAVKFVMGDVDGDGLGDGVAVVRSPGGFGIASMRADDRQYRKFIWKVSGPKWKTAPLQFDIGHFD
jgi:hypothetical protein